MTRSFQVVIDTADPAAAAAFWAEALDYVLQPPPEGFATWDAFADAVGIPREARNDLAAVVDPDGRGPRVLFQRVPEPKTVKNRVHLDVNAGGGLAGEQRHRAVDDEAERLCGLGAVEVARRTGMAGEYWVVLQDPDGNEFCVQ